MEELKAKAAAVAAELQAVSGAAPAATGGGSLQRHLPGDLRDRFIEVRAALFQRGIFDPVLVRFDTATATQASTAEIGQELAKIAETLG